MRAMVRKLHPQWHQWKAGELLAKTQQDRDNAFDLMPIRLSCNTEIIECDIHVMRRTGYNARVDRLKRGVAWTNS
jgi:hypothetical protein